MANSVNHDQIAPEGAVWSGSVVSAHVCLSQNFITEIYVSSSWKHLCTKNTPDFHLKYSKNGGNLGSEIN